MGRRRPQSKNLGDKVIRFAVEALVEAIFRPPAHAAARLPGKRKQLKSIQVAPGVEYLPPGKQRTK